MKWYKGYIEAAGNILIGAKRENGEFLPVESIEVFVNPFNGTAVKRMTHINKNFNRTIITNEILVAGDHKLFIFSSLIEVDPFTKPETTPEVEKVENVLDLAKQAIKRRGKK